VQDCVNAWAEGGLKKGGLGAVDVCLGMVLGKFGDASSKVRAESSAALSFIADAGCIGPSHVAGLLCKPLTKQKNAPKPIAARLALLCELVDRYGVRENTGLSAAGAMGFVKSVNGFAHTSNDVRRGTKELCCSVYKNIGKDVEQYLGSLRPKQLEEYREAFYGGDEEELGEAGEDLENEAPPSSSEGKGGSRGRGRGKKASKESEVGGEGGGEEGQYEDVPDTFTYE